MIEIVLNKLPGESVSAGPFTTLEFDPCPGDPDDITALGADLRKTAVLLTETALELDRTDASQDRWKGRAADAFRTKLNTHRATPGKVRAALENAAALLDDWARELHDFQQEARRLDAAATPLDEQRRKNAQALTAVAREAHDFAGQLTGVFGQANQLHERYLEAARAIAQRVGGLLDLPSGTKGWYGTATDARELSTLQAAEVYDQNVKDALAYFDQHLKDTKSFFSFLGPLLMLTRLQGLTSGELAAFAEHLTPEQMNALNDVLGSNPDMRAAWSNLLLGTASPETLATLQKDVPNLQLQLTGNNANAFYQRYDNTPLFGPNGPDIRQDLHQGGVGDCWFLSSVAAIAERDPAFFQQHIKENPNGTYTVTFYQDGKPVPVTVDNQLPVSSAWNGTEYAHPTSQSMWVSLYEKAYAQYKGGYNVIDGGHGYVGLHDLTGQHTQMAGAGDTSLDDLAKKIDSGYAVTSSTKQESTGILWWSKDQEYADNDKVVSLHEYSVERVNTNAHPPTVTLLNPWGPGQVGQDGKPVPQEVTMTEDEWHQHFNKVSFTKTRV